MFKVMKFQIIEYVFVLGDYVMKSDILKKIQSTDNHIEMIEIELRRWTHSRSRRWIITFFKILALSNESRNHSRVVINYAVCRKLILTVWHDPGYTTNPRWMINSIIVSTSSSFSRKVERWCLLRHWYKRSEQLCKRLHPFTRWRTVMLSCTLTKTQKQQLSLEWEYSRNWNLFNRKRMSVTTGEVDKLNDKIGQS